MRIDEVMVGQQVMHRRPIRSGNLVEIGNVVAVDRETGEVTVDKPQLYKMERVRAEDLEDTGPRFNIKQSPTPSTRTINDFLR